MKKSEKWANKSPMREVILLVLAAFFGILGYPFTRTSATPYFNAAYGAEYLPWAMIAAAVLAIAAVFAYNRLAKRFRLISLCISICVFVIIVTTAFGFVMGDHPKFAALLYYAWSDVYIMILVEQFWSICNTLFDGGAAKRYYGVFLTSSATGGLVGNAVVSGFAEKAGSANLVFLGSAAMLIYLAFILLLSRSIKRRPELEGRFSIEHAIADGSFAGGGSLVFKSRYLLLIAALVLATQVYINSAYFLFNANLAKMTGVIDKQSALYGKTFMIVQLATIFMGLAFTPLALRFFGVAKTHFSIIAATAAVFLAAFASPQIALIAVMFIIAKSFDYSIFRAAKEMFYIPLSVAEKFQAKSFIDVFIYRFSKAAAAFGIILFQNVLGISAFYLAGCSILVWLSSAIFILRRYKILGAAKK